ncbi:capsular biosynthesis protein [Prosthecochloris sp. GSB1]|uniref:polysaccharide biosynthesis/export family protein n=1 Tax=Prosthecochloris sp. GSB1 TaxID=281093 RepID=UPI000B8CF723|nr:polysaccharide biosynthesis/export family protein [Prosthecochloris sp. GSB1]ASQ89782.1 capsular biosynthesis protein [Prosthecochloris sp. GSB1]
MMPSSGPSSASINNVGDSRRKEDIRLVPLDGEVLRKLSLYGRRQLFSEVFGDRDRTSSIINPGDVLEVTLWEVSPALFAGSAVQQAAGPSTSVTIFPAQMVSYEGSISIPYAGKIPVAGRSIAKIEQEIVSRLKGKANQPQVIVRISSNNTSTVTVVGEVASSLRMPLTDGRERVLDALAAAGGTKQAVEKMTLQLTRGSTVQAMPLGDIIRNPGENITLMPDDVVTLLYQPLSFTALGATGKNQEVNFEALGISLAQALGRVGGLEDRRADARGVFVFRFEPAQALGEEGGKSTPVIYTLNLKEPAGFFLAQNFRMRNGDVLYVSNAPAADLKKFLDMVVSAVYPVVNIINTVP